MSGSILTAGVAYSVLLGHINWIHFYAENLRAANYPVAPQLWWPQYLLDWKPLARAAFFLSRVTPKPHT